MCMKKVLWACILVLGLGGLSSNAYARFDIMDHSARATARGGAFVATADDGGAFFYNPAGLTAIEGNLVQSDIIFSFRDTEYESLTGSGEKITQTITLPNVYLVLDPGNEAWKWGVGVFVPFGSSTEWSENGPLRYASTYSDLTTKVINPSIAYQPNENISLGFGLDLYSGSVISRKMLNYGASVPGAADGKYELISDDAYGLGYNLGLLLKTSEKSRVGISYRSRFELMFKGQATVTNKPVPPYASSRESTDAKAKYNFPDIFMIGYAYDVNEKLTMEADFQWTNWSEFNGYYLDFDPNTATFVDQWSEKHLHDNYVYKIGSEYALTDATFLRVGALYSSDTLPASTITPPNSFDPSNPANRRYAGYLGWGYSKDQFRFNITLGVLKYADRYVDNGATERANGTYKSIFPQVFIGAGWGF